MSFGGGGSSSGQTAQQTALQTAQGVTNANLNLAENEQRKTILNALQGTRVFRGSALSRQSASDTAAPAATPQAPSDAQASGTLRTAAAGTSMLDQFGGLTTGPTPGGIAAQAAAAKPGK